MAASLRLGRQGILFGLKLSNLNKCSWATHPLQEHARHFFLSPWSLGKLPVQYKNSVCPCVRTAADLCYPSVRFLSLMLRIALKKNHFLRLTHISDVCRKYTGLITGFQNLYLQYTVRHQQRCPSKRCQCINALACTAPDLEKRTLAQLILAT